MGFFWPVMCEHHVCVVLANQWTLCKPHEQGKEGNWKEFLDGRFSCWCGDAFCEALALKLNFTTLNQ